MLKRYFQNPEQRSIVLIVTGLFLLTAYMASNEPEPNQIKTKPAVKNYDQFSEETKLRAATRRARASVVFQ